MCAAPAALPSSDLDRLLATEQRLEQRLATARAEAEALIAAARGVLERREAALAGELEREERRLAEALAADRLEQERAIAAQAEREAMGFERIPPERVTAVARELAQRFLVGMPE